MIKSKVLNGLGNKATGDWVGVMLGIVAVVLLRSFLLGRDYPSPLELFIWYPTIIISGYLVAKVMLSRIAPSYSKGYVIVLISLLGGFLVSLIPFWGDATASMPLSLSQILTYIITLGVYPAQAGPDGLLRGIAWCFAITVSVFAYKKEKELFKAILIAIVAWLGVAVVMLLPSIVLIITMAVNSLPITLSGADMIKEFTRINLFSYWSDGQLLRWFTGFGGQATNALLLYAGSWIFVIGCMSYGLVNRESLKQAFQGFKWHWLGIGAVIVVFGYMAGQSHQAWVGIDVVAWLVFIMVLALGWIFYRFEKFSLTKDGLLSLLFVLGLMLLGWPIVLGGLVFIFPIVFGNTLKQSEWGIRYFWVLDALNLSAVVLLFVLFMRRGVALEPVMVQVLGVATLFALLAGYIGYVKRANLRKIYMIIAWLVVAILLWFLLGVFTGAAIMLLVGVFMWLLWEKMIESKIEPGIVVWGMAVVVLLVLIYLPRLAHPELIPR
jgi:hypothetical protein